MKTNGQAELGYKLPEFEKTFALDIAVAASQLKTWLAELPIGPLDG